MSWSFRNKEHQLFLFSLAFFFAASFIIRYVALQQTYFANGWDGYYYVMQAHSWLTYGYLQSLDYSLIYPYFTLFSYITNNYELAYKIGASLLSGGLIMSAMILVRSISKANYSAIFVGAFLLFSPTITFITAQFPKNVLGLIVLNLFLTSINKKKYFFTSILFIISLFTHRMAAGMCLIIILLSAIQHINIKILLGAFALIIIFSLLPGILHISDFSRLNGQLNVLPQFTPHSFYKLYGDNISLWWILELALIALIIFYLIYSYVKTKDFKSTKAIFKIFLPILLVLSVFPFFKMNFGSMGYRFFMIVPLIASIYLGGKMKIKKNIILSFSVLFIASSMFSYTSYNPIQHDPPNKLYELIINRIRKNYNPNDFPLVIVHKSLAELIIYKTEFDALNWAPPVTTDISNVLRIVHNLEYYHFAKYLSEEELDKLKKLTLHYYAIPETGWNKFIKLVIEHKDEELIRLIKKGNNPLESRPFYLRKGKSL